MRRHPVPRLAFLLGSGAAPFPTVRRFPCQKDPHEPELTPQRAVIISILLLLACGVLFAAIVFLVSV